MRVKKGLTQEELAEKLDISVRYVQHLEGVNCPNVKLDTIAELAKVLSADPADLLQN
ncbi:MAG: helix-turn-helix transcriptional regulator [Bdellovibrionaceae bacterium]|nr:helix-turn-helix transcriptional regulator [Pseudobdellovibrionaceae bacterium]